MQPPVCINYIAAAAQEVVLYMLMAERVLK